VITTLAGKIVTLQKEYPRNKNSKVFLKKRDDGGIGFQKLPNIV
jgi:hypothetical protein